MKFTKEEISLCKQVAEKHEKEIKYGDWFWDESIEDILFCGFKKEFRGKPGKGITPLWTISDCLEFLREKEYLHIKISSPETEELHGEWWQIITMHKDAPEFHASSYVIKFAKTLLEACLKAVLAVLEEKK